MRLHVSAFVNAHILLQARALLRLTNL